MTLLLVSCSRHANEAQESDAEMLYARLKGVTERYIDSVKVAKDSVALRELMERYEAKFDKESFATAPNADLMMTEGQNDTLRQLQARLLRLHNERLSALSHEHLATDTIEAESELHPAVADR